MKTLFEARSVMLIASAALALVACETTGAASQSLLETAKTSVVVAPGEEQNFKKDRQAILAMAGDYKVKFDFIETVSFVDGYEMKDRKISGAHEVVRVIEDRGDFISLQHILVVGDEEKFPIKHWRQDWRYEPKQVLTFIGGNAWEMKAVPETARNGTWSQAVYQVDDSPRYGAVGVWSHANGMSEWTPPKAWRPLPRRDMTTRDDYHAVDAVNRHAITPAGWVHEQDNSKLVLSGAPQVLVREIAINTYDKSADFDTTVADEYWAATADYWKEVRALWTELEQGGAPFGITVKGETGDVYSPLLGLASQVQDGELETSAAVAEARQVIANHTTIRLEPLARRLRTNKEEQVASK